MHDSPLVCLEPWNGMGTLVTEDDVFEHKRGMRILEPGQRDEVAFALSVILSGPAEPSVEGGCL